MTDREDSFASPIEKKKKRKKKKKKKKKRDKLVSGETLEKTKKGRKKKKKKETSPVPSYGEALEVLEEKVEKKKHKRKSRKKVSSLASLQEDLKEDLKEEEDFGRGAQRESRRPSYRRAAPVKVNYPFLFAVYGIPTVILIVVGLYLFVFRESPPSQKPIDEEKDYQRAMKFYDKADKLSKKFVQTRDEKIAKKALEYYDKAHKILSEILERHRKMNKQDAEGIDHTLQEIQQKKYDIMKIMGW